MRDFRTEQHVVINDDRTISVPKELRKIAVQFDHNVETVTFDCPRYWDGIDMSKMTVYVNYMRADRNRGMCLCKNVTVDETDDTLMHFAWTLTRNATLYNGKLIFLVCIKNLDESGNEINHWNSELCDQMQVSEGLECEESVMELHQDIITDLLLRMDKILIANTPILDKTLTERGLAADAKATGDAINRLREDTDVELGELEAMVANEFLERRREIAVERARIDQFVALKEGSTTGDAELQDIRIDVDGVEHGSAGDAVRSQFVRARSDIRTLGELEKIVNVSENIFDKNDLTYNTRLTSSGEVGTPSDELASYACSNALQSVDASKTYHASIDTTFRIAEFDKDQVYIQTVPYTNTGLKTPYVPSSKTAYIRFQLYVSQIDILTFCEATYPVTKNIALPFGKHYELDSILDESSDRAVKNSAIAARLRGYRERIDVYDTGDIVDFYNSMIEAFRKGNCDVYIHDGEYVYTNEFIELIRASDSPNRGIPIGNNCNYYFSTASKLVCHYTGSSPNDEKNMFSALDSNNTAHSWGLYNLTLDVSGVMYAIHDEASGNPEPYKRVYEHCYVTMDATMSDTDLAKCIGGGAGANGEIIIKDCYFGTINPLSSRSPDISYHGSENGNNVNMVVTGCYFENGFECHTMSNEDGVARLLFANNSLKKMINNPVTGNNGRWIIHAWNNDLRE